MSGGVGRRTLAAVFGTSRVRGAASRAPSVEVWHRLPLGRRVLAAVLGLRPSGVARGPWGGGGGSAAGTPVVPGAARRRGARRDRSSAVRVQGYVPVPGRGGAVGLAGVGWATAVLVGGALVAGLAVVDLQQGAGRATGLPPVSPSPVASSDHETYYGSDPTKEASASAPPAHAYWKGTAALPLARGDLSVRGIDFDEGEPLGVVENADLRVDDRGATPQIVVVSGLVVETAREVTDYDSGKAALEDCEAPLLTDDHVDASAGRSYCFETTDGNLGMFTVRPDGSRYPGSVLIEAVVEV